MYKIQLLQQKQSSWVIMTLLWIDVQGDAKWKEFSVFQTLVESVILTLD